MSETNTYLFSPIGKGDFSPMAYLSVEELKVKHKENSLTLGKQVKLVQYNETKAGQIVVSYVLFVAVMFSLITSSSSSFILRWIRWVLFSQILLISASFWLAITMVIKRLVGAKYHYELSLMVRQMLLEEILRVQNGQMKSPEQQQAGGRLTKPDPVRLRQWYTNLFAILSPLIAFTVLTLYALIVILLDGK